MPALSPLYALAVICVAALTSFFLLRCGGVLSAKTRLLPLDGLRGFLALFVLLHHSSIWLFYLHTAQWRVPPSYLYTHFGQSSVVFFFMLTAFLFTSKLLRSRMKDFDFSRFYISRVLRLTPLYVFAVLVLLSIVGVLSGWQRHETWPLLLGQSLRWLGFTMLGAPDINGVIPSSLLIAKVTWTLRYEWLFYLLLPVLAVLLRVRFTPAYGLCALLGIVGVLGMPAQSMYLAPFLGGMLAALLQCHAGFTTFARSRAATFLTLLALGVTVWHFPTAYAGMPLLLLSVAFCLIASGNTLFGILVRPVFLLLGEISYSLYLLHGLSLFVLFQFVLGPSRATALSVAEYWLAIVGLTPCLVLFAFATYCGIERPCLRATDSLLTGLRGLVQRWRSGQQGQGSEGQKLLD